jgi:flagellin
VALIINHNMMAMNAARNLGDHYDSLAVSTRRLSSGLRIGTAADDAAGLAIRELMRADIATLNQGIRNANDAISMVQTADGALQVIDEKLIRMRELAEQAATGTYNSTQRLIIDSEYQAMASEITRIANSTDFNGILLLNGNLQAYGHNGNVMTPTGRIKIHFGTGNLSANDYYYVSIGNATASALGVGNAKSRAFIPPAGFNVSTTTALNQANSLYGLNVPASAYNMIASTATFSLYSNVNLTGEVRYLVGNDNAGRQHVLSFNSSGALIHDTTSQDGFSISTQDGAQRALASIQNAIVSKDLIRANLGALQNRLQNTITNLQIQAENLQGSESRISDADVAAEMTEFVREQILTQAAVAMLAQANSLPKMAMQLIGG